jgi:hypothetical protein
MSGKIVKKQRRKINVAALGRHTVIGSLTVKGPARVEMPFGHAVIGEGDKTTFNAGSTEKIVYTCARVNDKLHISIVNNPKRFVADVIGKHSSMMMDFGGFQSFMF